MDYSYVTGINRESIVNMDETPCYFDLPHNSTVDAKGMKNIHIATSGYEKMRFTTVLACTATGRKLMPFLIFKNLKNVPKLKKGEQKSNLVSHNQALGIGWLKFH